MSKPKPKSTVYSWMELQEVLRNCTSDKDAQEMLDAEKNGPARMRWILRIHQRLCALRLERERSELLQGGA